jgi:hypothetical protein
LPGFQSNAMQTPATICQEVRLLGKS